MANSNEVAKAAVIPASMEGDAERYAFSPGRFAGPTLLISGQAGSDDSGSVPDAVAGQIDLAFMKLQKVLADAGMTLDDVVGITSYHVGNVADQFDEFVNIKSKYFRKPYPAWTSLGVTTLADARFRVEIAAVAYRSSNE